MSVSPAEQKLANEKINGSEIGYYVPEGHDVPVKVPIYAVYADKGNLHCYVVLKKHIDNTPVYIRIPKKDYIIK